MPPPREDRGQLELRTLVIASLASLAAALVTAQFWVAGTPLAAALTPVIVAIVSELLNRPTEAIARRVTTDRTAVLPPATGRAAADSARAPGEVRIYRSEPRRAPRRFGRVHPGLVAITAVLAFAIAAAALTLPELLAGQSIGKGDGRTTLFGGRDRDREPADEPAPVQTAPDDEPSGEPPPQTPTQEEPPPEEPPATTEEPPLTVPTVPPEPVEPPQ